MITLELTRGLKYYEKMDVDIEKLLSDVGDVLIDDYYKYITTEGRGTKGGKGNPIGGAPVDTGELIASHQLTKNTKEKKVTVGVPYAKYVINGTSNQIPNNYPQRGYNTQIKNNISKTFEEIVHKYKLDK